MSDMFANLHEAYPALLAITILIVAAVVCGALLGRAAPQRGTRSGRSAEPVGGERLPLTLVCVGSATFTIGSILIGTDFWSEPARAATSIATGVGLLGAAVIMRTRGRAGVTHGVMVWCAGGIGLVIGGGQALAGLLLTGAILLALYMLERLPTEGSPCNLRECRVTFRPDHGLARIHLMKVLDRHEIPRDRWRFRESGAQQMLILRFCDQHARHRAVLYAVAGQRCVTAVEVPEFAEAGETLASTDLDAGA